MNTEQDVGRCPSEFSLERLRLGESDDSDAGRATAHHVGRCAACTSRMAEIAIAPPPLALDAVWRDVREQHARGPNRFRLFAFGFAGVAAISAAVILLLVGTVPSTDLVKGGPWALTVIAKPRGQQEPTRLVSGARLSPGDRLRFEVSTTWPLGYAAIISLDSAGVVSVLVPRAGQAIEVRAGRRILIDGAVELDKTLGHERIELLGCPRPLPVATLAAAAREALLRQGGDLRRVAAIAPDCHQETFWIEKVKP